MIVILIFEYKFLPKISNHWCFRFYWFVGFVVGLMTRFKNNILILFLTHSAHYVVTGTPVDECCSAFETHRGLISGKCYQTVFNLDDSLIQLRLFLVWYSNNVKVLKVGSYLFCSHLLYWTFGEKWQMRKSFFLTSTEKLHLVSNDWRRKKHLGESFA